VQLLEKLQMMEQHALERFRREQEKQARQQQRRR
jgi:hypothetical protein